MSPSGYRGHAVAQKNFKRLLLRVKRIEQLPVIKDASQGRLPGSGFVISHLKNSHDREEKEKKKGFFLIGFLKLILPSTVAT